MWGQFTLTKCPPSPSLPCGFPLPCLISHQTCRRTCCDWGLVWTLRTLALLWPLHRVPVLPPQLFPGAGVLALCGRVQMCLTIQRMLSALRGRPVCIDRLQVVTTFFNLEIAQTQGPNHKPWLCHFVCLSCEWGNIHLEWTAAAP